MKFLLKFTFQVSILICISVAGEWIQKYFGLLLPGSLVGLIMLFTLLSLGILHLDWFELGAEKLVAFIPFFLIPSTTGVMNYGSFFMKKGFILVLAVITSTLLILVVSGYVSQVLKLKKGTYKRIESKP